MKKAEFEDSETVTVFRDMYFGIVQVGCLFALQLMVFWPETYGSCLNYLSPRGERVYIGKLKDG